MIAARGHLTAQQLAQPDTDRVAIMSLLQGHANAVSAVLASVPNDVAWLAARRGTSTGEAIIDVYPRSPQRLRSLFDTLSEVWSGQRTRRAGWIATAVAELINHIRNHLFHGVKAPDDANDQELLRRVNPILLGLLDRI